MELDSLYPASYYDIPVTGEWYPEEMSLMRELAGSIAGKGNYTEVVCFHPEGGEIFEEAARSSRMGELPFRLARDEGELREALSPIVDREGASAPDPASADACSLLRFSLGAEVPWNTRLTVKSSFDRSDVRLGKAHIAELRKGGPVPSVEGGEVLWRNGWCRTVVIDDFVPKGTVFAQGVLSTEGRIRAGDIVLVGTDSEFRGVGRAVIPGHAMTSGARGNAVRMLDHVRG
jgi:archaeosine synthase